MNSIAIQNELMSRPQGRPKKNAIKRTFRIDRVNMAMLKVYAEQNAIDVTAALNQLIRRNLAAAGLLSVGEDIIAREDAEAQKEGNEENQPN